MKIQKEKKSELSPESIAALKKLTIQKRINSLIDAIKKLKINQKLIMGALQSDENITEEDLEVVKWAYERRFHMLHQSLNSLKDKN